MHLAISWNCLSQYKTKQIKKKLPRLRSQWESQNKNNEHVVLASFLELLRVCGLQNTSRQEGFDISCESTEADMLRNSLPVFWVDVQNL